MPMRTVLGFVAYVADTGTGKPIILKGAQGKVYSVNDVGLTTPLACRDLATEAVIPNPTSNEDGFILPFKVSISDTASGVLWVSGEYVIYQPFLGIKGEPGAKGETGGISEADMETATTAAKNAAIQDATTKYGALPDKVALVEARTTTQTLTTQDLNTLTEPGIYGQMYGSNATTARHYPNAGRRGTLEVKQVSGSTLAQTYTASSGLAIVYLRELSGSTWSSWTLQTPGASEFLTTENLNTLRKPGIYGQNSSAAATPERNYPTASRGSLLVTQISGDSTVLQEYQSGGSDKTRFVREYYAASWSDWESGSAPADGGGAGSGTKKLVGTALTVSGGEENNVTLTDYGARLLLDYAVTIPRWRVHIRNHNLRNDFAYPGALNLMGFTIGEAESIEGKPTGRWVGGTTEKLLGAATTPADASEWVSPWFSYRLESHKRYMLSYGFTAAVGQTVHRGLGAVWSVSGGSSATHTNSYGSRGTQPALDIWMECEVPEYTPVLAVAGDSYSVGNSAVSPVHDSWLAIHCRRVGALPMFWATSGERLEWVADPASPKAKRYAGMSRPTALYVALGSNDINNGATLEVAKTRFHAAMNLLRGIATTNIILAPVRPPEETTGADAELRKEYNDWLRDELPGWATNFIDTNQNIVLPDGVTLDPKWRYSPTNIHLTTAGYGRMAATL